MRFKWIIYAMEWKKSEQAIDLPIGSPKHWPPKLDQMILLDSYLNRCIGSRTKKMIQHHNEQRTRDMNECTYGSQVTGCDRETDCQWCRSSNIRTTLITNAMHNKDQHECDQCFDNDALNWLQILVQQSISQHSIQNIGWSCELISLKGRKIIEISNFVLYKTLTKKHRTLNLNAK